MSVATVHARRHIHRGRVLDIGTEDVTLPTGVRTTLDVLKHPGASCVLPVDDDGVVLIRQFRHCADGWLWEAPAGTLNAGETPEQCARREVTEEAGLVASRLEHVGFVFTAPGFTDEKIHLWLAHDCTPAPSHHDDDEVPDGPRQGKQRAEHIGDLQHEPACGQVEGGDPKYVAALQLGEQSHGRREERSGGDSADRERTLRRAQ